MLSLVSLSFLFPWALALAPAGLGALIYAYRRRAKGTPTFVSTAFILRQFIGTPPSRKNFFPPLRFFIDLLALLLVLFAAAGMEFKNAGAKVAILIDNSLSMQARGSSGISALSEVAGQAEKSLGDLAALDSVQIFLSTPALHPLSDTLQNPGSAKESLSGIEPAYGPDMLESALQEISQMQRFDRILVFSDKRAQQTADASSVERIVVNTMRSGKNTASAETPGNIALSHISVKTDSLDAKNRTLQVTVQSFAAREANVEVRIFGISAAGIETEAPLASHKITLASGEAQSMPFSLEKRSDLIAYKAELLPGRQNTPDIIDAISEDNFAYVSETERGARVRVFSPLSGDMLGLGKIKGLDARVLNPAAFTPESDEAFVIFHRNAPAVFPDVNALFVMPEGEPNLIRSEAAVANAEITSWDNSHPLTAYVQFTNLQFHNVRPLVPPNWAQPVIRSSAGVLAWAGMRQGKKIVALGFELFPYQGKDSPGLSVLTLNIFKWLGDLSSGAGWLPVGSALKTAQSTDAPAEYLSPRLDPERALQREVENVRALAPGIVSRGEGGKKDFFAFNFFDETESNVRNPGSIALPKMLESKESASSTPVLGTYLIWAALAILCAELVYLGLRTIRLFGKLFGKSHAVSAS